MSTLASPAVLLLTLCLSSGQDSGQDDPPQGPTKIPFSATIRKDWVELGARNGVHAAFLVPRALNEDGEPYVADDEVFDCDPREVRRFFKLPGTRFLLGEPIVVEFVCALDGEGTWTETIGGAYRGRGRDDNFLFVLRHEDGTRVPDPYRGQNFRGGGLSTTRKARRGEPVIRWAPLQRWCAIERPGRYTLDCIRSDSTHGTSGLRLAVIDALPAELAIRYEVGEHGQLTERSSGQPATEHQIDRQFDWIEPPASPLLPSLPADFFDPAEPFALASPTAWTRFEIEIVEGSADERRAMVERTIEAAEGGSPNSMSSHPRDAFRAAMVFARQDDFLLELQRLAVADPELLTYALNLGFAMRPSPTSLELLLQLGSDQDLINALAHLNPAHRPAMIPHLIRRLDHDEDSIRVRAEHFLHLWTGEAFLRDWEKYRWDRPTLDEGRAMKPRWSAWWDSVEDRAGYAVDDDPSDG